jgi:glycosyltransferase involved in cell wall biosynthesis
MAVLSTPERDLANGLQDMGPPANQYHIREWNTDELRRLLGFYDLNVDRIGLTQNNTELQQKTRMLALLNGEAVVKHLSSDAPPVFRVVAIIATYNDEPIIEPILKGMIHQGVEIHIVDNWSTDKTWEICNRLREENRQIIGLERFPEAPPTDYMWQEILHRKAQLAHEIDADWFIHCDSDEIRMSPWPDKNLREAIYQVDTEGYNAIDFTMLVFYPTTPDEYPSGASPEGQLQYFDFGHRPGHFLRINAWKKQPEKVNLAEGGGHNVQFSGRRLYPYKFLTKHYSVLSQSHGEKKILLDRLPRTEREFTQRSAHTHLRLYKPGHIFYRDPQSLHRFDDDFYKEFLVEAISGVGVYEDPQST